VIRRLAAAAIVAICVGAPIVEMFDQWDHTLQDGNDTEANVALVALTVGLAIVVSGIVLVARIRGSSLMRASRLLKNPADWDRQTAGRVLRCRHARRRSASGPPL
jgi:hypothetical protein